MSAALPPAERPVPTVAIVGNDAVLAAAPATPVQLAHACLRRGFTVAVPASWGDELVAAETVRRLVGRERGPAVMCVCPFVRSRLLAPGPDLAPFLISLVAPSVAVARYVRAVYGEQAVHVTYIGSCPAADDPAIDVSLTPDAFFADIAEHGIALSEQPLVFDSIVPPDRRRWCSVPGGVPSPEVLWNEADGRTLVEIDRDDAPTDIAQHIITREHVLLDLAPGLGCACSGAVPPLAPRSARVAVTALEPPRAFAPVIDAATVVSLDAPVRPASPVPAAPVGDPVPNATPAPESKTLVDDVLDQEIGTPVPDDVAARLVGLLAATEPLPDSGSEQLELPAVIPQAGDAEIFVDSTTHAWREIPNGRPPSAGSELPGIVGTDSAPDTTLTTTPQPTRPAAPVFDTEVVMPRHQEPAGVIVAESDIETLVDSPVGALCEDVPESEPESLEPPGEPKSEAGAHVEPTGRVRRRMRASVSVRPSAASVPRTAASGGRSLPRAYVAKRRVPLSELTAERSATSNASVEPATTKNTPDVEASRHHDTPEPVSVAVEAAPVGSSAAPLASAPPSMPTEPDAAEIMPAPATSVAPPQTADASVAPLRASAPIPASADRPRPSTADKPTRFSPPDESSGPGPLVILLLVALVGLTAFVIWTLSR